MAKGQRLSSRVNIASAAPGAPSVIVVLDGGYACAFWFVGMGEFFDLDQWGWMELLDRAHGWKVKPVNFSDDAIAFLEGLRR